MPDVELPVASFSNWVPTSCTTFSRSEPVHYWALSKPSSEGATPPGVSPVEECRPGSEVPMEASLSLGEALGVFSS